MSDGIVSGTSEGRRGFGDVSIGLLQWYAEGKRRYGKRVDRRGGRDLPRPFAVRPTGLVRLTVPCGVSRARALAFAETKVAWIASARQRVAARQAAVPPLPPEAERERIEELRRAARVDLPPRVERIARMFGFSYGRITIRASRTKWGSCSFRNDLSLSLYLMALPERLRDYVIVHELCHTVHHDHSPRFHALVDRCLGGQERALDRELKSYVIRR